LTETMKRNLPLVGIAVSLVSMPVLLALPQSLLVSDVTLSQEVPQDRPGQGDERRVPLFGKITAIHDSLLEVVNPNGEPVVVKLTPKTEFRKDRQPAKRSDFKVGDIIIVRGDENADHSWTAQVIAARSMGGGPGNGPSGRGGFEQQAGTLGKDFVTGEVKSIDPPKIEVLRPDNVTQSIELNEETSLRKGRDSITMADIQAGDHVFARGALQNDVFVPKMVVVIAPEQWKRMQEMGLTRQRPFTPRDKNAQPQKPPEPQN
jgi:Domain of unknown function (DUF5666)